MPEDVFLTWSEVGKGILRQKKAQIMKEKAVMLTPPKI